MRSTPLAPALSSHYCHKGSVAYLQQEVSMIDWIFWTGVEILKDCAAYLGMTYQEVNVWLFIVAHPMITLLFICLWLRARFVR